MAAGAERNRALRTSNAASSFDGKLAVIKRHACPIVGYPMVSNSADRDYAGFDPGAASMRTLTQQLTQYAAYHRDRRNIATHFIGIPMIVLALAVLLSRPAFAVGALPWTLSPAWVVFFAATLYYLVLDVPLGVMMAFVSALCVAFGQWAAAQSTFAWLVIGVGLFLVGWVFQFIGHIAYEHRKPAFVDDVIGLLIGPVFVLAEALFGFGWRPALREAIEAQVGPTRINADQTAAHR
jgi:uncharacterized membrane protein YGL010W